MRVFVSDNLLGLVLTVVVVSNADAASYTATLLQFPLGFSFADARSGSDTSQVGGGGGIATDNYAHALLWNDAAANVVDLSPLGFSFNPVTT
jgi:hypothetical protein